MSTIVLIEGEPKVGKTTLALSFARCIPIAEDKTQQHYLSYFEMDVGGLGRADVRFRDLIAANAIRHKTYFLPQQGIREQILGKSKMRPAEKLIGMYELWYSMLTDYIEALEDPLCDAVVFDSWAQVWNLCTSGVLQEKQDWDVKQNKGSIREKLLQIEYGEPNGRMRAILYGARELNKDLFLIVHLEAERRDMMVDGKWKEGVPTGNYLPAGWSHIDKEINVAVRMRTDWVREGDEKKLRPFGKVRLCGDSLDAVGVELQSPEWGMFRDYIALLRG